jgi:hypothetical protein
MLTWVVIIRQHLSRAPRGPRQSRKSGPIRALPLPTLLFNISTFKSKLRRGWRAEILVWSGPSTAFPSYPLSFQTIAHSFALTKNSTLFFSSASALFAKNHPGWGVLMANQELTPMTPLLHPGSSSSPCRGGACPARFHLIPAVAQPLLPAPSLPNGLCSPIATRHPPLATADQIAGPGTRPSTLARWTDGRRQGIISCQLRRQDMHLCQRRGNEHFSKRTDPG